MLPFRVRPAGGCEDGPGTSGLEGSPPVLSRTQVSCEEEDLPFEAKMDLGDLLRDTFACDNKLDGDYLNGTMHGAVALTHTLTDEELG